MDPDKADGLWYVYYESLGDRAGNKYDKYVYQPGNSSAQAEIPNALNLASGDKTLPTLSDLVLGYEVAEDGTTTIILTGIATDDGAGLEEGNLGIGLKHALTGQTIWLSGNLQTISLGEDGSFQLSTVMDPDLSLIHI